MLYLLSYALAPKAKALRAYRFGTPGSIAIPLGTCRSLCEFKQKAREAEDPEAEEPAGRRLDRSPKALSRVHLSLSCAYALRGSRMRPIP